MNGKATRIGARFGREHRQAERLVYHEALEARAAADGAGLHPVLSA